MSTIVDALAAFVARIRSKRLRLATNGLPENFGCSQTERAKRPPGLRTRKASEITLGLSVERLATIPR